MLDYALTNFINIVLVNTNSKNEHFIDWGTKYTLSL